MHNATSRHIDAAKKMKKAAEEMGLLVVERPAFGLSGYTCIVIGPFGFGNYSDVRDALLGRGKP